MTWPIYQWETDSPVLKQHNAAQAAAPPVGPGIWCAAVDVWRDGQHLWRNYSLGTDSETVFEWADRELPAGVAQNHNDGPWRIPGLEVVDFPIPTETATEPVGGPKALRNLLCAMVAIAQYPNEPDHGDSVPSTEALQMRAVRSDKPYRVISIIAPHGVVLRVLYGKRDVLPDDMPESPNWHVRLERREVRSDAYQTHLEERAASFILAPGADVGLLLRSAKSAIGLTGWPAQRVKGTNVWHLTGAPYRLVIEPVDSSSTS